MSSSKTLSIKAAAALLVVITIPAKADYTQPAPPADAQPAQLNPVTVTGARVQYRATDASSGALGHLPLIDTPYSLIVLSRDLLDNQQAATYGDYLKNDPSATVGNVPVGFASLRGFSIGTDGYLYDGLPGNVGLSDGRYQISNLDRVEILKGPSAFLYGLGAASSVGGSMNFIPKRQGDVPVRSASATYTGRALFGINADIGDRFGADRQFGFRVNVGYKDGEQAVRDADWTHKSASLSFDWRAAPGVTSTTIIEYANNQFPQLQPFFVVAAGVAVPKPPKATRNIAQSWDDFETEARTLYQRVDWELNKDWSVTAQLLDGEDHRPATKNARFGSISDSNGDAALFGSISGSTNRQTSGQVLLHGKFDTAFIRHQLTFGLSGSEAKSRFNGDGFLGVYPTNLYNPVDAPEPDTVPITVGLAQKSDASGVLLSDILSIGSQWSLLLGARYSSLEVRNYDTATDDLLPPVNKVHKTAPTAALIYKPVDYASLYANYAQGLEQGGVAPMGTSNGNQVLAPIETEQFEIGGKLELARITLTAAIFDIKRPFEYVDTSDPNVPNGTFVQKGEQEHRGFELGASGAATEDLSLVAGVMLLDPTTKDTGDAGTEGKRPVGVSRLVSNLFADYRVRPLPGLFVNGGVYHVGKQFLDGANTQTVKSSTRFDLGIRYETRLASHRTAFLLGVENIADKNYWANAQSGLLTLAEPRTIKATLRYDY
ncbi:TonB-dependent siderophore receptor [uncultured Nevskia sp.]|uniref:TonB-dependent receptor n=1 Tax=uncultured Nevskia sp. TaxID=228950 RepID=UPI0025D1CCBB|nr:TonB-dependent siderophore receptor [uncultured Nevskia sp.]